MRKFIPNLSGVSQTLQCPEAMCVQAQRLLASVKTLESAKLWKVQNSGNYRILARYVGNPMRKHGWKWKLIGNPIGNRDGNRN